MSRLSLVQEMLASVEIAQSVAVIAESYGSATETFSRKRY